MRLHPAHAPPEQMTGTRPTCAAICLRSARRSTTSRPARRRQRRAAVDGHQKRSAGSTRGRRPHLPAGRTRAQRAMLTRALQLDPADRFASAAEMRSALAGRAHCARAEPSDQRTRARRRCPAHSRRGRAAGFDRPGPLRGFAAARDRRLADSAASRTGRAAIPSRCR